MSKLGCQNSCQSSRPLVSDLGKMQQEDLPQRKNELQAYDGKKLSRQLAYLSPNLCFQIAAPPVFQFWDSRYGDEWFHDLANAY